MDALGGGLGLGDDGLGVDGGSRLGDAGALALHHYVAGLAHYGRRRMEVRFGVGTVALLDKAHAVTSRPNERNHMAWAAAAQLKAPPSCRCDPLSGSGGKRRSRQQRQALTASGSRNKATHRT